MDIVAKLNPTVIKVSLAIDDKGASISSNAGTAFQGKLTDKETEQLLFRIKELSKGTVGFLVGGQEPADIIGIQTSVINETDKREVEYKNIIKAQEDGIDQLRTSLESQNDKITELEKKVAEREQIVYERIEEIKKLREDKETLMNKIEELTKPVPVELPPEAIKVEESGTS